MKYISGKGSVIVARSPITDIAELALHLKCTPIDRVGT